MTATNALERFQAFQEILADQKLDFNAEWVADGNFEEEGGYKACRKIMGSVRKPSAILCSSDLMAMGAIRALQESGLSVPGDVSVVGFDDIQGAAFHNPSLTTIRQPLHEMGAVAARILLQRIRGQASFPDVVPIHPELVIRESTCPPRRARPKRS